MVRISSLLNLLSYASAKLAIAPLFLYLDLPVQLALPAALTAGVFCDRRRRYPFSGSIATPSAGASLPCSPLSVFSSMPSRSAANTWSSQWSTSSPCCWRCDW